jgi:hypothetical protein
MRRASHRYSLLLGFLYLFDPDRPLTEALSAGYLVWGKSCPVVMGRFVGQG